MNRPGCLFILEGEIVPLLCRPTGKSGAIGVFTLDRPVSCMSSCSRGFLLSSALMGVLLGGGLLLAEEPQPRPTADEAVGFVARAEAELETLSHPQDRAAFRSGADETRDLGWGSEDASRAAKARRLALAREAARYDGLALTPEIARKLARIKLAETLPAPADPAAAEELDRIAASLAKNYIAAAEGIGQPAGRRKRELYRVLRESRDPVELAAAWKEWQRPARGIREPYRRMVELANQGARELGYPDVGSLWRSQYDMPPEGFEAECERLWRQVEPLYAALHCHVRARLRERYGDLVPERGPIPAHLLGNMWAQEWTGIESLVGPGGPAEPADLTRLLNEKQYTPQAMVSAGEQFFVSLGFDRLPSPFWQRSIFAKPEGQLLDNQGSAWPIDPRNGDVRLRMGIEVTEKDFRTVYHELGHIYYFLAYAKQPFLFQEGPNPGFHEAIGDTIALSITPEYLHRIGLLDRLPSAEEDLPYLFHTALDKIPRLAMAIVVDLWRWKVFSGQIPPERYNAEWWELRRKYQGISPPSSRTEADFDAGMFYHVSQNIPYDRYFTALLLQFDFHRALCEAAGHTGPLHRGSIYGSSPAGQRLRRALALGASRPWPDVLEELTGHRQMDASALNDYFAPVLAWLQKQNQGRPSGW